MSWTRIKKILLKYLNLLQCSFFFFFFLLLLLLLCICYRLHSSYLLPYNKKNPHYYHYCYYHRCFPFHPSLLSLHLCLNLPSFLPSHPPFPSLPFPSLPFHLTRYHHGHFSLLSHLLIFFIYIYIYIFYRLKLVFAISLRGYPRILQLSSYVSVFSPLFFHPLAAA